MSVFPVREAGGRERHPRHAIKRTRPVRLKPDTTDDEWPASALSSSSPCLALGFRYVRPIVRRFVRIERFLRRAKL